MNRTIWIMIASTLLGFVVAVAASSAALAQSSFTVLLEDGANGQNAPLPPAGNFTEKGEVTVFDLSSQSPAEIYAHSVPAANDPGNLASHDCPNSSLMSATAGAVDPADNTAKFFIADTSEGRFIFVVHNTSVFGANTMDVQCLSDVTDTTNGRSQVRFDFHDVPGPGPFPELTALDGTSDYDKSELVNPLPANFACRVLDDPNQDACNTPTVSGTDAAVVITQSWDAGRTDGAVIGPIPPGCGWTVDIEYKSGQSPRGLESGWKIVSANGSEIALEPGNPTVNKTMRLECVEDQTDVELDLKPQSFPNGVNICGGGVLPLAFIGSTSFDPNDFTVTSVRVGDVEVGVIGRGNRENCVIEDVTGNFGTDAGQTEINPGSPDGFDDLVCQIPATDIKASGELGGDDVKTNTAELTVCVELTPVDGGDITEICATDSVRLTRDCFD